MIPEIGISRKLVLLLSALLLFLGASSPVCGGETYTWTGSYREGHPDGDGTLCWYDSGILKEKYVGTMARGKANGKGTCTWFIAPEDYEGNWVNGKEGPEERYEGDWLNGMMHGTGIFTWPDGSRYEG